MPEGNDPQQGNQNNGNGQKQPDGPNMRMSRNVMSWLILLGLAMVLVILLQNSVAQTNKIKISEFEKQVENDNIKSLIIIPNDSRTTAVIRGELRSMKGQPLNESPKFETVVPFAIDHNYFKELQARLPQTEIKGETPSQFMIIFLSMLPWLLIAAFIWFVIFRQIRSAGGGAGMLGNFGRSKHRVTAKEHTNVTFADVAGIEEAKEEVTEIIEFLRSPKKFQRLGGRVPRGVLLVGEPGCGKTLLAKAIAGEADVPFFSISGSDFVEMFVGVGASRVRDLFKQAKENSPCIIFLDEIDAVGRRRGASFSGGGHDEREQTLNAILVEMDGFDTNSQVIVIAATNRVDVLDPALIRPGRFDRQVVVSLPDLQGRYEILKVHSRKIRLGPSVDLKRVARGTPMFSGAELAAVVNEAALLATLAGKEYVEQDDMEEARDKVRFGRAKKSRVVDERDRKITAYHEAGHALIQALEKDADPVHKVSIIPRGPAGGATFSLPEKDRMVYTKGFLTATMRVLYGGRIAEDVFFNEISSGASQDIKQATAIAKTMVRDWGMSDQAGLVYYGDEDDRNQFGQFYRGYSEKTAEIIDSEIKGFMDRAYADAERIINEHRQKLEAIAQALLKYETITGDEVNALIRGETIERASVSDLLDRPDSTTQEIGVARPAKKESEGETGLDGGGTLPQPG